MLLLLEDHDLKYYFKGGALDSEGYEEKAKEAKKIVANSIKDHLIQHVSSLKTPKVMFDALTNLYEGKGINMKLGLKSMV